MVTDFGHGKNVALRKLVAEGYAFASFPPTMDDLPDTLLGDIKYLSQRRDRLTFLVSCADFSIAFTFGGSTIGYGELRGF
jgi:hypothetical protein